MVDSESGDFRDAEASTTIRGGSGGDADDVFDSIAPASLGNGRRHVDR